MRRFLNLRAGPVANRRYSRLPVGATVLGLLTAVFCLLTADSVGQTILGKHPADKFTPAFWLQNTNRDSLVLALNVSSDPLRVTNLYVLVPMTNIQVWGATVRGASVTNEGTGEHWNFLASANDNTVARRKDVANATGGTNFNAAQFSTGPVTLRALAPMTNPVVWGESTLLTNTSGGQWNFLQSPNPWTVLRRWELNFLAELADFNTNQFAAASNGISLKANAQFWDGLSLAGEITTGVETAFRLGEDTYFYDETTGDNWNFEATRAEKDINTVLRSSDFNTNQFSHVNALISIKPGIVFTNQVVQTGHLNWVTFSNELIAAAGPTRLRVTEDFAITNMGQSWYFGYPVGATHFAVARWTDVSNLIYYAFPANLAIRGNEPGDFNTNQFAATTNGVAIPWNAKFTNLLVYGDTYLLANFYAQAAANFYFGSHEVFHDDNGEEDWNFKISTNKTLNTIARLGDVTNVNNGMGLVGTNGLTALLAAKADTNYVNGITNGLASTNWTGTHFLNRTNGSGSSLSLSNLATWRVLTTNGGGAANTKLSLLRATTNGLNWALLSDDQSVSTEFFNVLRTNTLAPEILWQNIASFRVNGMLRGEAGLWVDGNVTLTNNAALTGGRALVLSTNNRLETATATLEEMNTLAGSTGQVVDTNDLNTVLATYATQVYANEAAHGEMFENSAGSAIAVTTAGVFYQWTSAGTGLTNLVSVSEAADQMTVLTGGGGLFQVNFAASYSGTASATVTLAVYKNGTVEAKIQSKQRLNGSGDLVAVAASGLMRLVTGDVIDLRVTTDASGSTVTVQRVNLNMARVMR